MDAQERLILTAALAQPPRAVGAWKEFRETVDLEAASPLLSWAAGYVHENLTKADLSDRYLWGIFQHNLIVNARVLRATEPCITELSATVKVVRIKSFARLSSGEKLGTRPLADLDIVISRKSLVRAVRILDSHGFFPGLGASIEEFWERIVPQRNSWGFENSSGDSIDLHWSVFDHLDEAANRRIAPTVSQQSVFEGRPVNVLDPAVEIVLLAIQQRLQFSATNHLLIDFWRLSKRTDPDRIVNVARQANSLEWVYETWERLEEVLGHSDPDIVAFHKLRESNPVEPLEHNRRGPHSRWLGLRTRQVFGPQQRFSTWLLYFLWVLGHPRFLEPMLIRLFGGLSSSRIDSQPDGVWMFGPGTSRNVGPGWTYRFPGREVVWSRFPEGRLLFQGAGKGLYKLSIHIDWDEWIRHPLDQVALYVNGDEAQIVKKKFRPIQFQLRNPIGSLEICFRPSGRSQFIQPGIFHEWYNQMLPIKSITLTRTSDRGDGPHENP